MSRAMNLTLTQAEVRVACSDGGVVISAMEPLPAGGTHLVCMTSEGADAIRATLNQHIITKAVRRYPFYRAEP
jgi:hypothetical protein